MLSVAELHAALSASPKCLDNHTLMYDERGSILYDHVCQDPGYYTFRNDLALHEKIAPEVAGLVGKDIVFADFGCGMCRKSSHILKALENPKVFVALDIDPEVLKTVKSKFGKELPNVKVETMVADYSKAVSLPEGRRLGLISCNLHASSDEEVATIVDNVLQSLGQDGVFLTSFDANQDPSTNSKQYTETCFPEVVLNALPVMNQLYGSDFDPSAFRYKCRWNEDRKRVEHCLVAKTHQVVTIEGKQYVFEKDEAMRLFSGNKRSAEDFAKIVAKIGAVIKRTFYDDERYICMVWIEKK